METGVVSASCSHGVPGALPGNDPPPRSHTWLLARSSSSWDVGLKASVFSAPQVFGTPVSTWDGPSHGRPTANKGEGWNSERLLGGAGIFHALNDMSSSGAGLGPAVFLLFAQPPWAAHGRRHCALPPLLLLLPSQANTEIGSNHGQNSLLMLQAKSKVRKNTVHTNSRHLIKN